MKLSKHRCYSPISSLNNPFWEKGRQLLELTTRPYIDEECIKCKEYANCKGRPWEDHENKNRD